tara:strand:+ start:178 stop:327 length:150 start_codon:yes stop_codon:yes gene_type:complete
VEEVPATKDEYEQIMSLYQQYQVYYQNARNMASKIMVEGAKDIEEHNIV